MEPPRDLLAARHGRLPKHLVKRFGLGEGIALNPDEFSDEDDKYFIGENAGDGAAEDAGNGAENNDDSDSDSEVHRTFRAGDEEDGGDVEQPVARAAAAAAAATPVAAAAAAARASPSI